ncbi:MAG: hypothetical protein PVG39_14050 [Desulfobacteraceae bacterium]
MYGLIPAFKKYACSCYFSSLSSISSKSRDGHSIKTNLMARLSGRLMFAGAVFTCLLFMAAVVSGQTPSHPETITVSFQGSGSSTEECSGDWGYQRISYNMEVEIEVVGVNPSENGDMVTYQLSNKTGTIHFYGTAEDSFWGETQIYNFNRTQEISIEDLEGTLVYSLTDPNELNIGFSVPPSASLPYTTYLQYSKALGIVRNTVNMPSPWSSGVGCLSNNYDVPGSDDLCFTNLTIDKSPLPPGDTTKIHAFTNRPIDPAQPLVWEIEPVEGCEVKAKITPDGNLGEKANVTDVEGKGWLLITVSNPSYPGCGKKTRLLVGCECSLTSGNCKEPGNAELELHSIAARFSLGRTKRGESAGNIFLEADTPDPDNATPLILKVYEHRNDLTTLYDSNGLRQIVAPDAFVDINVISVYGYTISFYERIDMGPRVGGYYTVNTGAVPIVTWTIENPDALPTVYDRLRMTETKDGLSRVSEYIWDAGNNSWNLSRGNGLQITTRTEEIINGDRVVTETIEDDSTIIASKIRTTYSDITYNGQTSEEIIEIVEDPDGDALTTIREWYQDPCAAGSCGNLAMQTSPDGSWVKYEYDSMGRKSVVIRSWLDASSNSAAGAARAIYYNYSAQDASDSQAAEDSRMPRKITETILGIETSTTFYVYINNGDGSRIEIVERAATQGASYRYPGNQRTTTEYYPHNDVSADSWRIKSITHPDGTLDSYTYEYGTYTPNADPTLKGTFTSGSGTDILERIRHGTISNSWGIPYKSTGEQNIYNNLGNLLEQATYVSTGSGYYSPLDWTIQIHDEFGHVIMTSRSDGTRTDST